MTNTLSPTVSDEYLNCCIQIEAAGNPTAKAKTSSAFGLGQFLNATWLEEVQQHAPQVMQGRSKAQILALRSDPEFSIYILARFSEDNQKIVGMNCTDGDLYLAHFLGVGSARDLFRAPASTPVSSLVSQKAINANRSILYKKTAGQVRAWAAQRIVEAKGHDWIAKYWHGGHDGAKFGFNLPVVPIATDGEHLPANFKGDVDLFEMQTQLKGLHYYDGALDGLWGGKSAAAISAFINDHGGFAPAPTSLLQFKQVESALEIAIDKAEANRSVRPVTAQRMVAAPETVAAIAPEVKPAKQSMWTAIVGGVGSFAYGVYDTVSGLVTQGWDFFTGHKDQLPASVTDPNVLLSWLHKVPSPVWVFFGTFLLGWIGYNAYKTVRKINTDIATGVR